jgi:hypothetical protein|tara:strand:- start:121 stop:243 length:123 start_codon:yes stop_codon:yes gene_type:complete
MPCKVSREETKIALALSVKKAGLENTYAEVIQTQRNVTNP